ncbi:MAG: tetratricopeptide repeat protein [Planctomycetota bacterium]
MKAALLVTLGLAGASIAGAGLKPGSVANATPQTDAWESDAPLIVEIDPSGPRDRGSVRALNASLERVVDEIARRTGRIVEGLSGAERSALVTIELRDRPLDEILTIALGAAGLRHELHPGVLRVLPDDSAELGPERLRERAMVSYLRATTRFSGHPAAERGRLSQGEVEEARGNLYAAYEQYQTLLDNYPSSTLTYEAHLRSGSALERMGRYADAVIEYQIASKADQSLPQHAPARLGLARCQIELGNPDLADVMIDTLDDAAPATSREEAAERGLVRAKAQLLREEEVEALATLDQLDRFGLPDDQLARSMELRAMAFEGLDLYREASRFWLVFAAEADPGRAAIAYERAASLAERDNDPLAVMFVAAEAERAGSEADLGPMARRARLQLGLLVDLDADVPAVERIEICERWVSEGRFPAARPTLSELHAGREDLPAPLRPRAALAWARCLYDENGLEAALAALREARATIAVQADRAPLDLLAADLLERERQFQRAMHAYEGRY